MATLDEQPVASATSNGEGRMRAVVARRPGGPEVLDLVEVAVPEPGPGQVRIRVAAAPLHPADLSTRAGRMAESGLIAITEDVPLGWDVAGHVDAVGPGVRRFAAGDAVIGLRDLISAPGSHADRVVLDEAAVAPAPRSVSLAAASTLPLNALTADNSLRLSGARRGDSILVTGAVGSVGGFVLQLAAMHGIETVAAVRPGPGGERARRLGAGHVVTTDRPLSGSVRQVVPGGVDAVVDAAVLGVDAHGALRSGGTFVALVRPFAPPPLRATTVIVQEAFADGGRLTELAALVDFGVLELPVGETVPFSQAAEAHARLDAGGLGGPIVLVPG